MILSKKTSFSVELPFAHQRDPTVLLAASELESLYRKRFQGTDGTDEVTVRLSIVPEVVGYQISSMGSILHLAGSNPIDLLYGIYDFAEEYLEFCFFEPGVDTCTASSLEVLLPEGDLLGPVKPLLKRRGLVQEFPFSGESLLLADWMAKNKLNYLLVWMKYYDRITPEVLEAFSLRGIEIESGHHNFSTWIPGEKYAESDPEFFAVVGGRRIRPSSSEATFLLSEQLCTTNPKLRTEIVRRMLSYSQQHPEIKTISLMPNDGFGWCECDVCSTYYDKNEHGDIYSVSQHVYQAGRIYHSLINEVSEQLHRQNPDLTLTFCAYVNYSSPAPGFRLGKKTAVHFAPYWRCVNHAIHDPSCWLNSAYCRDLKAWVAAKAGGEVNVYEYLMGINFYVSLPLVAHEAIFDEVQEYARMKVDGFLTQFHLTNWTAYGMNYYMMAKALYGAARGKTLFDFHRKMFGSQALGVRKFYDKLLVTQKGSGPCLISYPRALFNRTKIDDYAEVHQMALQLAHGTKSDFIRRLPRWTGYLLRFKELFDRYQVGQATKEEVEDLKKSCQVLQSDRVLVYEKLEMLLNTWIQCLDAGIPWLHFNIGWEDEYIRLHDTLLGGSPTDLS